MEKNLLTAAGFAAVSDLVSGQAKWSLGIRFDSNMKQRGTDRGRGREGGIINHRGYRFNKLHTECRTMTMTMALPETYL